jgi:hypothetical protein
MGSCVGQMVPFAGYELPVLYETDWGGIVKGKSLLGVLCVNMSERSP